MRYLLILLLFFGVYVASAQVDLDGDGTDDLTFTRVNAEGLLEWRAFLSSTQSMSEMGVYGQAGQQCAFANWRGASRTPSRSCLRRGERLQLLLEEENSPLPFPLGIETFKSSVVIGRDLDGRGQADVLLIQRAGKKNRWLLRYSPWDKSRPPAKGGFLFGSRKCSPFTFKYRGKESLFACAIARNGRLNKIVARSSRRRRRRSFRYRKLALPPQVPRTITDKNGRDDFLFLASESADQKRYIISSRRGRTQGEIVSPVNAIPLVINLAQKEGESLGFLDESTGNLAIEEITFEKVVPEGFVLQETDSTVVLDPEEGSVITPLPSPMATIEIPTPTGAPTATFTSTPSPTVSSVPTIVSTVGSPTPTATNVPSLTPTPTPTPTATRTPTQTSSPTLTPTPTASPSATIGDLVPPTVTFTLTRTNDTTPDLVGTIDDIDATVTLELNSVQYAALVNRSTSQWIVPGVTLPSLSDGTYSFIVRATDSVGNLREQNFNNQLIIDTTAPTIADVSISPSGTAQVGDVLTLTVTYDESVEVNNTSLSLTLQTLYINGTTDGTITFTYNPSLSSGPTLVFQSTVSSRTVAPQGLIAGSSLSLTGATITDGFSEASSDISGISVDLSNAVIEAFGPTYTRPLDTLGSLVLAYSVRNIRSAYSGPLIRVGRSSDSSEMDIGADSNGYLDVGSLLTFVGSGSGSVVTWYDQSGNGRHLTTSTQDNQPLIVSTGSLLLTAESSNTLPILRFDGVDDAICGTGYSPDGETEFSITAVSAATEDVSISDGYRNALIGWWETNSWGVVALSPQQGRLGFRFGTGQSFTDETFSVVIGGGTNVVQAVHNNSTEEILLNGSSLQTYSGRLATLNRNGTSWCVGNTAVTNRGHFSGSAQEIIVRNSADSLAAISSNLRSFFGTP